MEILHHLLFNLATAMQAARKQAQAMIESKARLAHGTIAP
jgi:hypothetical protein